MKSIAFNPLAPGQAVPVLIDPEIRLTADQAAVRACFSLTAAESKLALRLALGETLEDVAKRCGISYETARNQLKAVSPKQVPTGNRSSWRFSRDFPMFPSGLPNSHSVFPPQPPPSSPHRNYCLRKERGSRTLKRLQFLAPFMDRSLTQMGHARLRDRCLASSLAFGTRRDTEVQWHRAAEIGNTLGRG